MKWIPVLVAATFGFAVSSVPGDDPPRPSKLPIAKTDLPFFPQGLKTSPDERFAICWGAPIDPMTGALPGGGSGVASRYVVFDIEKGTVVSDQSLPQNIRTMHVDREFVYLAPEGGSVVSRSRHDSIDVVDKILLDGPAEDLVFLPSASAQLAVLCGGLARGKIGVYDVKTFERVRHPLSERDPGPGESGLRDLSTRVRPVAGGLFYQDGVLSDTASNAIQCVVIAPRLPGAFTDSSLPGRYDGRFTFPQWGRVLESHTLQDSRGTKIDRPDPFTITVLLRQAPLIVGATRKSDPLGRSPEIELVLREALTGGRLESLPLVSPKPRTLTGVVGSQVAVFAETSDRVLVGYPGGLGTFRIPGPLKARAKVPLHLKPPQIAVGRANGKLQFDLDAAGGTAGAASRKFSLLNEAAGLSLDSRTGRVTVDGPVLWKRLPQTNPEAIFLLSDRTPEREGPRAAEFERVTGKELEPNQVPLSVRIAVAVSDQEKGYDQLTVHAILLATEEELAEIAPKPVAGGPPRGAEGPAGGTDPPRPAGGGTDVEERIRSLEGRLRRTEAALEAALQQVEALERRAKPSR